MFNKIRLEVVMIVKIDKLLEKKKTSWRQTEPKAFIEESDVIQRREDMVWLSNIKDHLNECKVRLVSHCNVNIYILSEELKKTELSLLDVQDWEKEFWGHVNIKSSIRHPCK